MTEQTIPTDRKVVALSINGSKADGELTPDAVRKAWKMGEEGLKKANAAEFILAVENNTVVDIFEKHGDWYVENEEEGRYAFVPVPVRDRAIRHKYIGTHKEILSQNLVNFIGFDD